MASEATSHEPSTRRHAIECGSAFADPADRGRAAHRLRPGAVGGGERYHHARVAETVAGDS